MADPPLADPLRVGFVCGSSGGLIDALAGSVDRRVARVGGVVTDRPCGVEAVAARHAMPRQRVVDDDAERWSTAAAGILRAWRVDVVILLFLRRVGAAVWRDLGVPVWNLHPSLLPRHRGLGALARSHAAAGPSDPWLGVTMHEATGDPDTGPVLGQGRFRVADAPTLAHAEHLCFLLKLALTLEGLARLRTGPLASVTQDEVDRWPWHGAFRGLLPPPGTLETVGSFARGRATAALPPGGALTR